MKVPFAKIKIPVLLLVVTISSVGSSASALGISTPLSEQPFAPRYVAFGDSLTTGSSIATCIDRRKQSPWGCQENPTAAVPYPNKVAQALQLTYSSSPRDYHPDNLSSQLGLYRAGIWGYTLQDAVRAQKAGHNEQGDWMPQLTAIKKARQLVTGSLGINDVHFSNFAKWARLYVKPGGDHVTPEVQSILKARKNDFNELFSTLSTARDNGASVIVGLYYNPYDTNSRQCRDLKEIGNRIVDTLDTELIDRSHQSGLSVADFRRSFAGHGAGSREPYVFGTSCDISSVIRTWLLGSVKGKDAKKTVAIRFDPHPNDAGTTAMANAILQEYNNAD